MDVPVLVRLMIDDDVPWMIDLARRRYTKFPYDFISSEGWFRHIVLKSPLVFYPARAPNAFTVSMLSHEPWHPADFVTNVIFTCAEEGHMWEVVHLLRDSIEVAKKRRCTSWRIWSDTDYDIGHLARRVGAKQVMPRYELRL